MRRHAVDRLGAHAVEPDAELEYVVVVFCAGIDDRHAFDHLAQGNPAAVIADRNDALFDGNVDLLAVPHDEFVNRVVDHFFDQDVDTVVGVGSVAQASDIHSWT